MEGLELFKAAKSITDVYRISQQLKEDGYDLLDVNREASKRKKEIVSKITEVRKLVRLQPTAVAIRREVYTQFAFEQKHLNTGRIVFCNNKIII